MATVYGTNATIREAGRLVTHSNIRFAFDEYVAPAAVIATGAIKLMKLPAGSRIIGLMMSWDDHGTTGAGTLGWEANGVEAADADGIEAAVDLTSAGSSEALAVAAANVKFSAETQISFAVGTATDVSEGKKISVGIIYAID